MYVKRGLAFIIVVTIACGETSHGEEKRELGSEEFRWARLCGSNQRYLTVMKSESHLGIERHLHDKAIDNSVAWVREILKAEFVPEDLHARIEGIPAGLEGLERAQGLGKGPRFDCTSVSFDSEEHHIRVVQDSMGLQFFVSSRKYERLIENGTPEGYARALKEWSTDLFRHAEVSLYLRPIRLTDFGVDTPTTSSVWNHLDNRWAPTIVNVPKAWTDELISPNLGFIRDSEGRTDARVVDKLRQLDRSIPQEQLQDPGGYWWSRAQAATDGKRLLYSVPKCSGFYQSGCCSPPIPDWFRVIDPSEIEAIGVDKTGQPAIRSREAWWPPK